MTEEQEKLYQENCGNIAKDSVRPHYILNQNTTPVRVHTFSLIDPIDPSLQGSGISLDFMV